MKSSCTCFSQVTPCQLSVRSISPKANVIALRRFRQFSSGNRFGHCERVVWVGMASTKNRRLDGSSLRWHCDHGVVISILLPARSAVVVAAAVGGRSLSSCHDIGVPRDVHLCWCSRTEEQQVVLTPFAGRWGMLCFCKGMRILTFLYTMPAE